MEPLSMESVWLKQSAYEEAEYQYQVRLNEDLPDPNEEAHGDNETACLNQSHPLLLESIHFKQMEYEAAESLYQQVLAGTVTVPSSNKTPESFGEKVDAVLKDLIDKHRSWKKTYDGFQKHKCRKISEVRLAMKKLEDAVRTCSENMEKDIAMYEEHERQGQVFLQSLESTAEMIKELRNIENTEGKKHVGWRPICNKLIDINVQLNSMNNVGLLPIIKEGDSTRNVRKTVNSLSLFEMPKLFRKQAGRYAIMSASLETIDQKLNVHRSRKVGAKGAKTNFDLKNTERVYMDDCGVSTESLDGSLGDECLSDSWVSISELDLNEFNGGDGGYCVRGGGDGFAKKKQPPIPSSATSKATPSPQKPKKKKSQAKTVMKPHVGQTVKEERKPHVGQTVKEEMEDDESLDGSLGSEESTQGDLIACFASLQTGEGNGTEGKSKKKTNNVTNKSKGSSPSCSEESASGKKNQASKSGKNKIPPLMSLSKSAESKAGRTVSPSKKRKATDEKTTQSRSNFGPRSEAMASQQSPVDQRSKYERELKGMAQRLKTMLILCGQSTQVQEMFEEIELLLQMVYGNYNESIFKHRLSLLQMAFNFHVDGHSATGGQPKDPKSTNPQGAMPKQPAKDKKQKTGANPPSQLLSPSSNAVKIASFNPSDASDRHRAGISSMVIMDSLKRLVLVDIINGCLKLFTIQSPQKSGTATLLHSIQVNQPYYMTKFIKNQLLISRAGNLLTIVKVNPSRGLEVKQIIVCRTQYYGLGLLHSDIVACANYEGNSIDLVRVTSGITGGVVQVLSSFSTQCQGPELLSVIPSSGDIVFLERVPGSSMHVTCMDPNNGERMFSVSLGGGESDVWNLACVQDKIVCCCKMSNRMVLLSPTPYSHGKKRVVNKSALAMPTGAVKMPFAICFRGARNFVEMYVANDAAWEEDRNHYVTTQVNVYLFTSH